VTPEEVTGLAAGDRVYWWFDTGALGAQQVAATVVRVNRATVTVRNGFGELVRVRHAALAGRVDWEEPS
jgi:hypothetical protein